MPPRSTGPSSTARRNQLKNIHPDANVTTGNCCSKPG